MATNFEPHEGVSFAKSTKIGTHENKAIHSKTYRNHLILSSPEKWGWVGWDLGMCF